jgi:hypothetical protein
MASFLEGGVAVDLEISRAVTLAPIALGLLLYWVSALTYFRRNARRTAEVAIARAAARSGDRDFEVHLRIPTGRLLTALLVPVLVVFTLVVLLN